jgi:hypothetical protein
MSAKNAEIYKEAFNVLKDRKCIPENIVVDFEQSAIIAYKEVFPQVTINGCTFHFSQSIWRKVQTLGLKNIYLNNADFKRCVKMLLNLSFTPPKDVISLIDDLIKYADNLGFSVEFKQLIEYFLKTYCGYQNESGFFEPVKNIGPYFWSAYNRVFQNIPLTTNGAEA